MRAAPVPLGRNEWCSFSPEAIRVTWSGRAAATLAVAACALAGAASAPAAASTHAPDTARQWRASLCCACYLGFSQVHYYAAAVTSGAGQSEGQVNGARLVAV